MDELQNLAEEAALTKNASFMITFRKGEWKVNFNTIGRSFVNEDLLSASESATNWLIGRRSATVEVRKQYELKLK